MVCTQYEQAKNIIEEWQSRGLEVVFTNGCFDILHYGHIKYLSEAKDLGDRLVVGVNSDASVSRLKGPTRPLQDQQSRAELLSHLEMVDIAIIFDEDTPLQLIENINPQFLVKGGDYEIKDIVGADFVKKNGGTVKKLKFATGYSTSNIIEKIKASI